MCDWRCYFVIARYFVIVRSLILLTPNIPIEKPSIFKWKVMRLNFDQKTCCYFFFYQGFLSQILTIHRTAKEGREPSLIPLDHFHSLTNIEHLFQTLQVWWLSLIFNCNLVLQIKIFEILDFLHIAFKILGLSSQMISVLREIWDPRF